MLRYTNKRMFLLGWSHRYKYFTVVIWLTVMKYSFPIWQWIFSPLPRLLTFLSHWQNLCRTWLWYHGVCRIRNRNSLHFYDEVRLARLFSFLCCVFCFACLPAVNSVQSCMWIWIFHFLLSIEPPSVFPNVYRIPYIYFELILYCNKFMAGYPRISHACYFLFIWYTFYLWLLRN